MEWNNVFLPITHVHDPGWDLYHVIIGGMVNWLDNAFWRESDEKLGFYDCNYLESWLEIED